MLKYFLFFCTLCCACQLQAQQDKSLQQYYTLTNKAELAITDARYKLANELYHQAFLYKKPGPLDLYNAFIVAYMQKDVPAARSYFNQMVLHGMEKEKFETLHYGEKIRHEKAYKAVISQYDSVYTLARQSPMLTYARVMDSLKDADQDPREAMKADNSYSAKAATLASDQSNIAFLKGYIAQHGWPGFEQTGLFEKTYYSLICPSNTIWFILWHSRHISKELNEEALQAVQTGDFSPEQYALIMDIQGEQSVYYNVLPRTMDNYGKTTFLTVPGEAAVNHKRAELYLETLADYKRKLLFTHKRNSPFHLVSDEAMLFNFVPINIRTWENIQNQELPND